MQLYCTRPSCSQPINHFADLDNTNTLKTVQQKFCTTCGMPLILSGRYLPEKLLGQGGFGSAFFARDRFTPALRPCVVKLFQPSTHLNPQQLQVAQTLFEREAAVLESLGNQHPKIPDLYAFFPLVVPHSSTGTSTEFFYLVQEFIDGEDLEQLVDRTGALPEKLVKAILISILEVLVFVHTNGAIHRDIKPSNIMKTQKGELYLLDFGAVKQVTGATALGKSTGIYTMGYAPPELMSGGNVYPSSDLYSLAVTCIVLLTAKPTTDLYDSYANQWRWQNLVTVQDPILVSALNRMLKSSPSERYVSASEALSALKSPSAAAPPPPLARTSARRPKSPNRVSPAPGTKIQPPTPPAAPAPLQQRPAKPTQPPIWLRPLPEFLGGMAFTGFEGSLLAIATASLLGTTWIGSGTWLVLLLGLIFLQARRIIERMDLLIIAGASLTAVIFIGRLQEAVIALSGGSPVITIVVIALMMALLLVAIATIFRLIYTLLSNLL